MSAYAWIIDRDHLADPHDDDWPGDAGTCGPRDAPAAYLEALRADHEAGAAFRMYDDDGELYYSGRRLPVYGDEEADFGPLEDFGAPNAGATEIHYRDERGAWVRI